MSRLTDKEAAYIAGFIDGEGWFGVSRRVRKWADGEGVYLRPVGSVSQKIRAPLEWIAERTGGSISVGKRDKWEPVHQLRFHSGVLRWLIPEVMPYLLVKKRQAELVLQFLTECRYQGKKLTNEQLARREGIRAELECLNAKSGKRISIVAQLNSRKEAM